MYYRNAQAALVVYDITKPSSLVKAKHWVAELQRQASPGIVIALVGNMLDLANDDSGKSLRSDSTNKSTGNRSSGQGEEGGDENPDAEVEDEQDAAPGDARKISTREARSYADEEGLLFFETSAKTGVNVPEVFTAIANAIPETGLKGARGAAARTGPGHSSLGSTGRPGEDSRINLRDRGAATAKEGCAC